MNGSKHLYIEIAIHIVVINMIAQINNKKQFRQITKNGTVLVDFFTEWCGPCKTQAKILKENEEILKNLFTNLEIVKVDCDELNDIADEYSIHSIPSLVLFIEGEPFMMDPGVKTIEKIQAFIKLTSLTINEFLN